MFVTKSGIRPTTNTPVAQFLAADRDGYRDSVPFWWSDAECAPGRLLQWGDAPATTPVFWALRPNKENHPTTTKLYRYGRGSETVYSVDEQLPGWTRMDAVARVWTQPMKVPLPVQQYLAPLVADAGPDQCVVESRPGAGATVQFDARDSTHAAGTIRRYDWTWPGGTKRGRRVMANLPSGLHEVKVTTTGSDGATSTDNLLIRVYPCTNASGC